MTRLVAVHPEERRRTVAAFLTIFGTLDGHTLLETARNALFLARLPASQLSVVYLLIALVGTELATASRDSRIIGRRGSARAPKER